MRAMVRISRLVIAVVVGALAGSGGVLGTPAFADSMQGAAAPAPAGAQEKNAGDPKKPKKEDAGKKEHGHTIPGSCGAHMPVRKFVVDASGSVSDTGRTVEGPLCVKVFYNPIQSYVSLATVTTTVNGPDLSKVVTGSTASGGPKPGLAAPANISEAFGDLQKREEQANGQLTLTKTGFGRSLSQQETAIAKISLLRRTTKLRSMSQVQEEVRNGYAGLKDALSDAITSIGGFLPTDLPGPKQQRPLLLELQDISDKLARLPLAYLNLPPLDPKPDPGHFVCSAEPMPNDPTKFDPTKHEKLRPSWSEWSSLCKDKYDALKTIVDAEIQDAKSYTDASDNTKLFKNRAAVVQYWDSLFNDMGLRTDMEPDELAAQDISGSFYAATGVKCGTLFNQTANTAVNLVVADLGPTLEGKDPEVKAQGAFVTVSCSTPFSLSAGVGFSTIRQQEFAIVKSSGGTGNPSVNTFGVINDSHITPMPMVMANVRLYDCDHHKYAFHGSFGVSGNLQNQSSGGSAAEFLPAGTVSFWRTMYLSVGPQIGTKSELAGGFSVNQPVPSDITTINGQVKRVRTVGFGFAITFTKPN